MNTEDRIDRVVIGSKSNSDWKYGKSLASKGDMESVISTVDEMMKMPEGYILFVNENLTFNESLIANRLHKDPAIGVWYDDRISEKINVIRVLEFVHPGSYFNLPISPAGFSIWNISINCLLVKKDILRTVGFLDRRFSSVKGALMEWCYRVLFQGVLFQREKVVAHPVPIAEELLPLEDELRFIKYRSGRKWLTWAILRYVLNGICNPFKALHFYSQISGEEVKSKAALIDHKGWKDVSISNVTPKISIIIPTIERYPYLTTVLKQLKTQTILPSEVIVIDQTPHQDRQPDLFKGHTDINLRYFAMEKSGQCGSRNQGLLNCTGDFILFIDDDVEIKPDLLESHIKALTYFNADVSCGVCEEADAGPIPKDFTFIRHSDVFPTNNGMVRRSTLERSGLFDMAFDHGQRADGDLGARIYKTGARLILVPQIRVFHHRAPRGGLRKHNVRKMTYSSSRKYISHFRIPHITELYLNMIHFSKREQREYIILSIFGMFSIRGSVWKKVLKVFYGLLIFPSILFKVYMRNKIAKEMLTKFPQIPAFTTKHTHVTT